MYLCTWCFRQWCLSCYHWFTFYHFRYDELRSLTRPSHSKRCYHVTEMPRLGSGKLLDLYFEDKCPLQTSACHRQMWLLWWLNWSSKCSSCGSSLKASQHTSSDLKPHSSGHSWTSVHGWHLSISGLLCSIVSIEIFSENCSFKNKNKKMDGTTVMPAGDEALC